VKKRFLAFTLVLISHAVCAQDIHFLVPGGAGGGWDSTARGVGLVLRQTGLVESASFENISGAGGGKAIGTLIEMAGHRSDTLMINSTPIIVRSVTRLFPYSFHDLTPIARIIGDFQILAVRGDSPIQDFNDVLDRFRDNPRNVKVAGGSVRGDLDHLSAALAFRAAGEDPRKLAYVPYDAGGKALAGFLTGEGDVLSTGLGEVLEYHRSGRLRIISISSPQRLAVVESVPTYQELGIDYEFVNWRGFFAAPGLSPDVADQYSATLGQMMTTPEWETLRLRNGWQNLFLERHEFVRFLERQEREISDLLIELGFLRETGS
jgi:putative tricarboxylic transport membrane protein